MLGEYFRKYLRKMDLKYIKVAECDNREPYEEKRVENWWLGINELIERLCNKYFRVEERVRSSKQKILLKIWKFL